MRRIAAFVVAAALVGGGGTSARAGDLALGTLTLGPRTAESCPEGHRCYGFEVRCPGAAEPARGVLGIARPTAQPRGLVMYFSGGMGTGWWGADRLTAAFLRDLRARGIGAVQVRWSDPWLVAAPGEDAGPAHLACRPATVVHWTYHKLFLPLGIPRRTVARCGFCLTGNSGGSTQVSYALSHYGMDRILDAVIPTGGPPHAAQAKGCLRTEGEEEYWYGDWALGTIDKSYGFLEGGGPCATHDPGFVQRWTEESVDTGGTDYLHPATRVHFIVGSEDSSVAPAHARDYFEALIEGGSRATFEEVPGVPHRVQGHPAGLAAIRRAILGAAA